MYKFLLCARYLRTRYIALTCIVSVMLGVATMIVVNSVMSGFSTQMQDRIRGILSHVVLETGSSDGEPDPERIMARIQAAAGEHIEAMSPTVEVYGMLSFRFYGSYITKPVTLIGIDPASKAKMGTLTYNLSNYKPELDDDGNELAPARYTQDHVPTFDLHPDDQALRTAKIERQLQLMSHGHSQEPALPEGNDLQGDGIDPLGLEDALSETDESDETELADPTSPQLGRLYVGSELVKYKYEDSETGKIKTLTMVQPGDDVQISTISAGRPPKGVHFDATVVDYFKCGMSEYDSSLIFCNLDFLQDQRGMLDPETGTRSVTSVQIKLKDPEQAAAVVSLLKSEFEPGRFSVRTWKEKQGPLLAAVAVESAILNVLLFMIIAVAGFGILAIFFMIVVEKTRDIGILKALGAGSGGVMSIFLAYGLGLGIVGAGVGVMLGLVFVWNINWIEAQLTWLTGIEVFDERIYYFPSIPTDIQPMMVFWVAIGAVAIAVAASILPARRASKLHPVSSLRYE